MDRLFSKDLWAGLMFAGFGVLALFMGSSLAVGTPIRMGPGYVPRMLSYILIGLGIVIAVRAILSPGETVERLRWKPTTMITIGVIVFALLFERAGLAPAVVALIFLAALGGQEFKLVETVLASITLIILCIGIFKLGLDMNISIIRGVW
ncbi:MAG: tripartite tricarboxylate transporter TctB family protein [Alphaproteobacteria bacterium]|nr:tripartite tricarboxylate transporter TctB family protein [Alphaproteobacteria bacterium]MCW5742514.1 tripartite tricarboxylate transporter TctB family protein [Alphaproteobacteria bacterium]